jgi:gliding motility-associated-like protein
MKLTHVPLLQVILFVVFLSSIAQNGFAQNPDPCHCDFTISLSATETTFDGAVKGVKPGDRICFTSGTRTGIGFKNIHGTKAAPVIICNKCDGKVILSAPINWGNAVETLDSDFFRFTGSNNPAVEYGIEITGAQQGINLHEFSNEFEVDHLYVHDTGSCGIVCKTDPTCDPASWRGAFTLQNLFLHHNKIFNTGTEGFYIGNSHYDGGVTKVCSGVSTLIEEHQVDNVEISYNIINDTGNEGLQVGSTTRAVAHHNIITNAGNKNSDPAQANNFQAGSGTQMTAYANIMNGSKGYGVVDTGGGGTYYNNIMMNNLSGGMQLQDIVPNWSVDLVTGAYVGYKIYNNTFINNKGYGIWMYSENPGMTYYYNNIVVGQGEVNYKYVAYNNQPKNKWTESNNVRTQDITTVKFLDPNNLDFRLLTGSPAIDGGKDLSAAPFSLDNDYDGNKRPDKTGGAFDVGAFEFQTSGPTSKAGVDQVIQLPTNSVILPGGGNSATGITDYKWTKKSGPACTLANDLTANLTVTNMVEGLYVFELQVTDADGFDFDQVQVTVKPVTANQNPVADAGANATITLPTSTAVFHGIGTDADGTIAGYDWIKVSGPACTLAGNLTKDLSISGITTAGTYIFQLTVKDDKNATGSDQVNLVVNAAGVNQLPIVNAGSAKTIYLPTSTVSITATASDPDGTISTIAWTKKSGGAATLGTTNALTFNPTGLALGTYVFRITVTDNKSGQSFSEVTVNVLQSNQPPIANAGGDQSLTLPTNSINIAGSGTDNDGSIASYSWDQVSGPTCTLGSANIPTFAVTNMVQGTYVFGLTVTDNQGATAYDEVKVTVDVTGGSANEAPLAIAGGNVSFSLPTTQVNLYGSGFDPDGTITTYAWTKASGAAATLINANKPTLTVTGLAAGQYTFRLVVTDDGGDTDEDFAIVTVSAAGANISPVSSAGADKIVRLPQNSILLVGSGSDQDGTIASYQWTKVAGAAANIASPTTATTSVTGLVEGEYSFRLEVTDDKGATDLNDVIVRVVSATSNFPPVVFAGADVNLFLPASTYTFADATASDDGSITTYLWVKLSGPTATLNNPSEMNLSVKDLVQGDYTFQLAVTDNNSATVFDIVKLSVLPGSFAPPVVSAGTDKAIALPTTSINLTGTATAAGGGSIASTKWTKVNGPAATLTNDNTLTLSVTNMVVGTYVFKLTATDNTSKEASDNVQVVVDPVPPNKPPVVTAGINTTVTLPATQTELTGTAVDSDGTIASLKWTQTQGPNAATITNSTTLNATASGLVKGSYVFKLSATDNSGAIGTSQVIVAVVDVVGANQPPVVSLGDDISVVLPQDTVSVVGTAFDPDGTIGSYSWSQVSGNPVTLNVNQQTILQLSELSLGIYEFSLTATDDDLLSGSDTVKVFVIEKNQEIPKFFSPNNDGIGDMWVFRNVDDYQTCKLIVFARSGQVVYEANPYQNNWDGTHNGKLLAGGDYYYSLSCTDNSKNVKGALRIIR